MSALLFFENISGDAVRHGDGGFAHAKRFYDGFGILPLTDDPTRLFLPLDHAERLR